MSKLLFPVASCILLAGTIACNSQDSGTKKFIETSYIDTTIKPGDNFFKYVNGKWLDTAQIPSTESGVGGFYTLAKETRDQVKKVVEDAANSNAAKGSIEQLVGDFYAAGMDTATIEKRGYEPLQKDLDAINAIQNIHQLITFEAQQNLHNSGPLFSWMIIPDFKNSSMNIAAFAQGGLGLPDRDYYFKTDAATLKVVDAYKKYIATLFTLTGKDTATAAKNAGIVFGIEKEMATAHKTRVETRDPESNYHKIPVGVMSAQQPNLEWNYFLNEMGAKTDTLDVMQTGYYEKLNALLPLVSIDNWKIYETAHLLSGAANLLSSPFVNANFEYSKTLSGQQKIKPRAERISGVASGLLGEAIGQLYVKKYFSEDAKKRMLVLVDNLQKAFANRIDHLDWMSDTTKKIAKDKLAAYMKKIGFPDKWRDYSKVNVDKSQYYESVASAEKNNFAFQLSFLNKPVDKTLWDMTPQTVNAYYNPLYNEIVFPAAILQFPFFDPNADDAINYGGIGMVIGHEMTHGFDDQGAQYDKDGNLKNWWLPSDKEKFQAKVKQVVDLYNTFTVLDTLHVNGALTTGENMADIGGVAIAYDAFKLTEQGKSDTKIDGFTPDQRFFLSVAQIWRSKIKDELVRQYINLDEHSPAMWRVLGPLMNFTPFYKAFNVKEGDKMYKPETERIKIW
ncbi:MAG: M13 family metallopeptidase [Chitinophagaceae bacterium]|jgi:putative endopeptidase|nr:M13 family metallopeptidase [Chitinophagaceae bacterium]